MPLCIWNFSKNGFLYVFLNFHHHSFSECKIISSSGKNEISEHKSKDLSEYLCSFSKILLQTWLMNVSTLRGIFIWICILSNFCVNEKVVYAFIYKTLVKSSKTEFVLEVNGMRVKRKLLNKKNLLNSNIKCGWRDFRKCFEYVSI